jgi:hypothetical protein
MTGSSPAERTRVALTMPEPARPIRDRALSAADHLLFDRVSGG